MPLHVHSHYTFLDSLLSPEAVVALAVQPGWLRVLILPALTGAVVALAWGWWLVRGAPTDSPNVADAVVAALDTARRRNEPSGRSAAERRVARFERLLRWPD